MRRFLKRFLGDRSAAIAIYAAYAGTLAIGAAVVAIDVGRLGVVRNQLQNAADAAATAAAAQLNGQPGAMARAEDVARNAVQQTSALFAGSSNIVVDAVSFFRQNQDGALLIGANDANARYVRVSLTPGDVNLFFMPVLNLVSHAETPKTSANLGAVATAVNSPVVCDPVPLTVCVQSAAPWRFTYPEAAGRMVAMRERLHSAGGDIVVFHLICPPDRPNCTEEELREYLNTRTATQCVAKPGDPAFVFDPTTIPEGINRRFGPPDDPEEAVIPEDNGLAADNVIYYDRDPVWIDGDPFTDGAYGDGNWDLTGYWDAKHDATVPVDLIDASRFQTHLYELGQTFARNGRQTFYPVDGVSLPDGFSQVTAPGVDVPEFDEDYRNEAVDGLSDFTDSGSPNPQPPAPSSADALRRVIVAAVTECSDLTGWSWSGQYVKLLVTERAIDFTIFAEIIGPLASPDPNFVPNVRLVKDDVPEPSE